MPQYVVKIAFEGSYLVETRDEDERSAMELVEGMIFDDENNSFDPHVESVTLIDPKDEFVPDAEGCINEGSEYPLRESTQYPVGRVWIREEF